MASVIAAGSAYATHGVPMIPIYVFYSMFGFQRTGDLMWAMADQLANGFLLGATAGRTTLNGEGLQHEDGHSLLLAATNPACVSYDAAFAFELAIIVKDALRRMYGEAHPGEDTDVFYYLTLYNEPKPQPPAPDVPDLTEAVLRGLYRFAAAPALPSGGNGGPPHAQLLASGTAIHWALDAQRMLAEEWGVAADVWSVTSWTELRRDGLVCDRSNRHAAAGGGEQQVPWVTRQLEGAPGPFIAVSDWMRAVPDQIEKWVPGDWSSLGTDGFGRSDTREALRRYFAVDAESIVLATLTELARLGEVKPEAPAAAISRYSLG
jgi:pyruvate dehydrogenase E1 component